MRKIAKLFLIAILLFTALLTVNNNIYAEDSDYQEVYEDELIVNDNNQELETKENIISDDDNILSEQHITLPKDDTLEENISYAYAVLQDDGDLIFIRSEQVFENETSGTIVNIDDELYTGVIFSNVEATSHNAGQIPWIKYRDKIKKVYALNTIKPNYMYSWFSQCNNLISFNQNNFDTSEVEAMNIMFRDCTNLQQIDLSKFNTQNVKYIGGMFNGCNRLTSINLRGFNTENVLSMGAMFNKCERLNDLDISTFNTSKVESMEKMFADCKALSSLNLSHFKTSNVTLFNEMFKNTNLSYLDISSFDTSKATSMKDMFYGMNSLTSIKLGSGFTKWTKDAQLPDGIWKLQESDLYKTETELYKEYPSNTDTYSGIWDITTSYAVLTSTGDFIFTHSIYEYADCSVDTLIDVNGNSYNGRIFVNAEKSNYETPWKPYRELIKKVYAVTRTKPSTLDNWFMNCVYLESFNGNNFDTSDTKTMEWLFYGCTSLSDVSVGSFDTSNVTSMYAMFGKTKITSLSLNNFNTEKVKTMHDMFFGCRELEYLDISSFDTSNVTDMIEMFLNTNLKTIVLGPKFTVWSNKAYLPSGTWKNKEKGLSKSHIVLYNDYPSYASAWAGTWTLNDKGLDTPQLKSIFNVKNGIDVRFGHVENATSYIFIRIANGKETIVANVNVEDIPVKYGYLNWTDTSVKSEYGKGFAYKVIAKDNDIQSDTSDQLAIFRLNEPTISKLEPTSSSIRITWNKEKVHRYVLQYSTDGNNWTTIETTATNRNITNLKPNTTYYFRVRGVMVQKDGTIHYSQYSTRKSVKTK